MFASGRGVRTAAGNEPDGPWLKVSAPSNRVEANEGRASFCPRPVRDGRRIVLGPSGCGAKSRPLCKRFGVVGNTPSPPRSAASPRAEELTLQVARCSDQDRTLPRTYSRRPASPRRDPASFRTRLPRCWGGCRTQRDATPATGSAGSPIPSAGRMGDQIPALVPIWHQRAAIDCPCQRHRDGFSVGHQ